MIDDVGKALQSISQTPCFSIKYQDFSLYTSTRNGEAIGGYGNGIQRALYAIADRWPEDGLKFKFRQSPDAHRLVEGDGRQIAVLFVSADSQNAAGMPTGFDAEEGR